jgi:hypothetical protein
MRLSPEFWAQLNLHEVELPRFAPVRQHFPDDGITDVPDAVRSEIRRIGVAEQIRPGMTVAVTAGSRGINKIDVTLRAVVDELRALGAEPFIVPAMGSHGGATVEGQLEVLKSYGITEESMGCPIRATMDAVPLGVTPTGYTVYCDRHAFEADAIAVVNRVKPHSILTGDLGSGLMKMLGIGLGKAVGADAIHIVGVQENLLPAARIVLAKAKVLFGLAIVENSFDQAARIEAALPSEIEEADLRLLKLARAYLPTVPFDPLDVLIVQQMGKNFSGTGMDPNVIGMHRRIGGPPQREIRRIVALRLSEESHGNSTGLGLADIITEGLLADVDYEAMCINSLTSDFLWGIKQPIAAPTEEAAMRLALRPFTPDTARVVIIRDTAHLDHMWVSGALLPGLAAYEQLEPLGEPQPVKFEDGVLQLG